MLLCHVLRRGALVFQFQLARAATLGSFHVLEQHVIVRPFPAGNLGTTESAGAFIFREMKRSVSLRLLQRGHTRQATGTVAVKVHQAARESAVPAQKHYVESDLGARIHLQLMSRRPVTNSCMETPDSSLCSSMCSLMMRLIVELLSFLKLRHRVQE